MAQLQLRDDLTVSIGKARVRLSPTEGLNFAETLARKSFRRALAEEAVDIRPSFEPTEKTLMPKVSADGRPGRSTSGVN